MRVCRVGAGGIQLVNTQLLLSRDYSWSVTPGLDHQIMDSQMVVCATGGWGESNVPHLQWHGRSIEIRHYKTTDMVRFDVKFRHTGQTG